MRTAILKLAGVVMVAGLAICCFVGGEMTCGYMLLAANLSFAGSQAVMGD